MDEQAQRKEILKRLKMTRRNEGICLQGWQTEILVKWIEEMEERKKDECRS